MRIEPIQGCTQLSQGWLIGMYNSKKRKHQHCPLKMSLLNSSARLFRKRVYKKKSTPVGKHAVSVQFTDIALKYFGALEVEF